MWVLPRSAQRYGVPPGALTGLTVLGLRSSGHAVLQPGGGGGGGGGRRSHTP